MSRPICVKGGNNVPCPGCGKFYAKRCGLSVHYHHSHQCCLPASAAAGIGCLERSSNVGNTTSSVNVPIAPMGTQHKQTDGSHHDSDEADYPNADNEGSHLDTILSEVVPMDDDCAAIDNGNSPLAG